MGRCGPVPRNRVKSDSLISLGVDEISATEAARRFSDLLDEIEHGGESFVVTRHGKPVARIEPARPAPSGRELLAYLRAHPPDPDWAGEVRALREAFPAEVDGWQE